MNLSLINSMFNDARGNKFIQNFINELQNYMSLERGNNNLMDYTDSINKMITKFRDEFYIERKNILNNYAQETSDKGRMYYIYNESSRNENGYNLCICEEDQSNIVIEKDREELPYDSKVGSVLRENEDGFYIDEEATSEITNIIQEIQERLFESQEEYLNSKRVEGHIYELCEKSEDRVWLFDLTQGDNEAVEEINFPNELLIASNEGDLFIYQNETYNKK